MTDYTADEVEDAVENSDSVDEYGDPRISWENLSYGDVPEGAVLNLRGEEVPVTRVDGKPGAEGGGEEIYVVIRVGSQLFKKEGWYQSHYGEDWDGDLREVHAVERLVTFYE